MERYEQFPNLLFELNGTVMIISVNRPEVLNALNMDVFRQLGKAFEIVKEDDRVDVVILTGAGQKSFIAGTDIGMMNEFSCLDARNASLLVMPIQNAIAESPKPTIAAINGFAFGGGLEVALCCDMRIASEKAKMGQPEITLGIIPGGGGTQRLSRLVGPAVAKEMILTGKTINAQKAYEIGLVNKVVAHDQLLSASLELANDIARNSRIMVTFAKRAINAGLEIDLQSGLMMEIELYAQCYANSDCKEGLSAFIEKRKPNFLNK